MKRIYLLVMMILFYPMARCQTPMEEGLSASDKSTGETEEIQTRLGQAEESFEHIYGIITKGVWCSSAVAIGSVIIGGAIRVLLHLDNIIDANEDYIY